ncbi:Deoxyguanosinetriphosphate triphosphohydrolase-like protein [Micromonospora sp. MH33]|nr:Deoxyguanosinetriphosphate triphosphohydrolase-like protein [Micromonospora sp. MH33]
MPVFGWLRRGAPGQARCLEAQVMDWADDVAYSVHDVEDGIHGGYLRIGLLVQDAAERAALCADVAAEYSAEPVDYLAAVLVDLLADPLLAPLASYDGSHRAQAAVKDDHRRPGRTVRRRRGWRRPGNAPFRAHFAGTPPT